MIAPLVAGVAFGLHGFEVLQGDEGFVDGVRRPDPLVRGVPGLFGAVSEGDVVDVEQDLFFVLFVPYFVAGVARVVEDGGDGAFGPRGAVAVRVTGAVVG
ncbi:hypothetical protein ADK54_05275 [Streptomyces sp. WM6378]|nr:hypothetical protein ADK54_05275 [Streptomyces sp. WM6378]